MEGVRTRRQSSTIAGRQLDERTNKCDRVDRPKKGSLRKLITSSNPKKQYAKLNMSVHEYSQ